MSEGMSSLCQRLARSSTNDDHIEISKEALEKSMMIGQASLLIKLLTTKQFNQEAFKQAINMGGYVESGEWKNDSHMGG